MYKYVYIYIYMYNHIYITINYISIYRLKFSNLIQPPSDPSHPGAPPVHRMAIAQGARLVPPPARQQQGVARSELHGEAARRGGREAGEAILEGLQGMVNV